MVSLGVSMAFSCPELTHKGPSLPTRELRLHQVLGAHQGQLWGEASSREGCGQWGWAHRQDLEEPRAPVWTQSGCRIGRGKAQDSN